MSDWLDITAELTKEGKKELKVNQVLMFDYEGSPIHLKIMRKRNGKVWAKRTYLYKPEEADNEVTVVSKES